MKAHINVAALNMRGFGNPSLFHRDNKWKYILAMLRDKRIGILILEETHLNPERIEEINKHYERVMKVFGSSDPTNPTGRGGVAVVVNKQLVALEGVKTFEIVQGRALMVQLVMHKGDKINILAVYAPNVSGNDGSANAQLWRDIQHWLESKPHAPRPNVLMGDFNMVESGAVDRLPAHDDPEEAVDALDDLKMYLQLKDGWRTTFPDKKGFTFLQDATGSQSRIDRIYVTDGILETAREWNIRTSGVPNADHDLISVQITSENAPFTAKGRWRIPEYVVKDRGFLDHAREQGIIAKKELEELNMERSPGKNPQQIWNTYKQKIIQKARDRAREIVPGLVRKI
ncbi:DNase I-like protein, partial [Gymnopus androsaceus JB14]